MGSRKSSKYDFEKANECLRLSADGNEYLPKIARPPPEPIAEAVEAEVPRYGSPPPAIGVRPDPYAVDYHVSRAVSRSRSYADQDKEEPFAEQVCLDDSHEIVKSIEPKEQQDFNNNNNNNNRGSLSTIESMQGDNNIKIDTNKSITPKV